VPEPINKAVRPEQAELCIAEMVSLRKRPYGTTLQNTVEEWAFEAEERNV
jgi:hypothetical protein